jgi:hypothetical protein
MPTTWAPPTLTERVGIEPRRVGDLLHRRAVRPRVVNGEHDPIDVDARAGEGRFDLPGQGLGENTGFAHTDVLLKPQLEGVGNLGFHSERRSGRGREGEARKSDKCEAHGLLQNHVRRGV